MKFKDLEKAFVELKFDKTMIKIKLYESMKSLALENDNWKDELINLKKDQLDLKIENNRIENDICKNMKLAIYEINILRRENKKCWKITTTLRMKSN